MYQYDVRGAGGARIAGRQHLRQIAEVAVVERCCVDPGGDPDFCEANQATVFVCGTINFGIAARQIHY